MVPAELELTVLSMAGEIAAAGVGVGVGVAIAGGEVTSSVVVVPIVVARLGGFADAWTVTVSMTGGRVLETVIV